MRHEYRFTAIVEHPSVRACVSLAVWLNVIVRELGNFLVRLLIAQTHKSRSLLPLLVAQEHLGLLGDHWSEILRLLMRQIFPFSDMLEVLYRLANLCNVRH